jgi:hypothetical protein
MPFSYLFQTVEYVRIKKFANGADSHVTMMRKNTKQHHNVSEVDTESISKRSKHFPLNESLEESKFSPSSPMLTFLLRFNSYEWENSTVMMNGKRKKCGKFALLLF